MRPHLTRQQDVEGNFSNLPITMFSSTRFYIDVYFWLDGTTTIHQHGFAGAFQVLTGSSLHGEYKFRVKRAVSPHFNLGELSLKEVRLLRRGDIRKIIPGPKYISLALSVWIGHQPRLLSAPSACRTLSRNSHTFIPASPSIHSSATRR